MSTELHFINGLTHIGGIQVVLRTGQAEFFFDVGVGEFEGAALFNDTFPAGVRQHRLIDYLRSAMAPLAEGFYDSAIIGPGGVGSHLGDLRAPGRLLHKAPYFALSHRARAAYVSHLHGDHAGLLPYLAPGLDVHLSSTSLTIARALEAAGVSLPSAANLTGHDHGDRFAVGDIEITCLLVDHDTPGAMGFIARTPEITVAYTGDWRYHGLYPERLDAFARQCAAAQVDILITEASTAMPQGSDRWPWGGGLPAAFVSPDLAVAPSTEAQACEQLAAAIAAARGLVFVCLHRQQLERAAALLAAAHQTGRRVVVEPATARFWLEALRQGLLEGSERTIRCFEDDSAGEVPTVSLADVARDRDSYICQSSATTQSTLLSLAAGPGDLLIHNNGHPLGSQYPGWRTLTLWVEQLGLDFVVIDAHGHAVPSALQAFAEATGAPTVIPMHSDHVEEARVPLSTRYLPKRWECLRFEPKASHVMSVQQEAVL